MVVKDKLASILFFIFTKDREENSMPIAHSINLLCKIKQILHVENQAVAETKDVDNIKEEEN